MRVRGEEPHGGLPRNYLRASLLLLLAEAPAHGYDLLEQISRLGLRNVDPGGLYRALRVMEQDALVASRWETSPTGPARRSYELTSEGREWLHAWAGALREGRRLLSNYLDRYDRLMSSYSAPGASVEHEAAEAPVRPAAAQ